MEFIDVRFMLVGRLIWKIELGVLGLGGYFVVFR